MSTRDLGHIRSEIRQALEGCLPSRTATDVDVILTLAHSLGVTDVVNSFMLEEFGTKDVSVLNDEQKLSVYQWLMQYRRLSLQDLNRKPIN